MKSIYKDRSCEKNTEELHIQTLRYIKRKFVPIYFPYLFSLIPTFLFLNIYNHLGIRRICEKALYAFWEVFLFQAAGHASLYGFVYNGISWFIAATVFVMLIIFPIIKKLEYKFLVYIYPPMLMLFLFWKPTIGSIMIEQYPFGKLFRAYIGTSTGILIYSFSSASKNIKWSKFARYLFTIIEAISFFTVIIQMNRRENDYFDYSIFLL